MVSVTGSFSLYSLSSGQATASLQLGEGGSSRAGVSPTARTLGDKGMRIHILVCPRRSAGAQEA